MHSVWRPRGRADRWGLGLVSRPAAVARADARTGRDPRQRGGDDRAGARRLLPETRTSTASSSTRPSAASVAATSGSRTTRASPCTMPTPGPFLRRTDGRYDLIVVDAYHQPYVPFYLATREFFRLVRERLAPGGIVALNVAAVPGDRRLVSAIGSTLGSRATAGARMAGSQLQHARARADRAARTAGARAPSRERARPISRRCGSCSPRMCDLSMAPAARGLTTARRSSGSPTG